MHPSTLDIMCELGLIDEFLKLPHSQLRAISMNVEDESFQFADFSRISGPCKFLAFMPQWDFLDFLMKKGKGFPALTVTMQAEVTGLIQQDGRVAGVTASTPDGPLEIRADLVVGCDGRGSILRDQAGLKVYDLGAPIDVLWFRLSKKPGDPVQVLGRLGRGKMIVTLDRDGLLAVRLHHPQGRDRTGAGGRPPRLQSGGGRRRQVPHRPGG